MSAAAYTGARRIVVPHERLRHGDRCPECGRGNVYVQQEPTRQIRFVGQAPVMATVYERERLRCNACHQMFTAAAPAGVGDEKYDPTAASTIAQLKYGSGGATRTPSEPKARGGGAAQEMGVGPPGPLCRERFQITASCVG